MAGYNKVTRGDTLTVPAAVWNDLLDLLAWSKQQRNRTGPAHGTTSLHVHEIDVKNTSGGDLASFAVVGLDGPLYGPSDNLNEFKYRHTYQAITPLTAAHAGKFAILVTPIASGKFGRAVVAGDVAVQIEVVSTGHTFADVTNGDATKLTSGASGGAQILWKDSGTGLKWARVRLGFTGLATGDVWAGTAAAAIAAGATGNVTLQDSSTVVPTNWSNTVAIANTDKVLVWRDEDNGNLYTLKGGGSGSTERHLKALLTSPLLSGDPNASIGTVTTLSGGAAGVSPSSADNMLKWAGTSGEICWILEDSSSGSPLYYLESVEWDLISRTNTVDYDTGTFTESYTKREFIGKNADLGSPVTVWTASALDLVTNVTYDSGTLTETKYYRSIPVLPGYGAESNSVIWTATATDVLTSVDYDSGALKETKTKKSIGVLPGAGSPSTSDVWQATLKTVVEDVRYTAMAELQYKGYVAVLPGTTAGQVQSLVWQGVQCYTSPAALPLTFQALQSVELWEDGGTPSNQIQAHYYHD